MELPRALLSPNSKNKKNPLRKNFLYFLKEKSFSYNSKSTLKKSLYFLIFQEMELIGFNIQRFLLLSQKKAFLMFWEMKTPKKFVIFQKT